MPCQGLLHDLVLCDLDPEFIDAAKTTFSDLGVSVLLDAVEHAAGADGIVWPGNSHGVMASGIDSAMVKWLGPQTHAYIQSQVQAYGDDGAPLGHTIVLDLVNLPLAGVRTDGLKYVIYVVVFPRSPGSSELAMMKVLEAADGLCSQQSAKNVGRGAGGDVQLAEPHLRCLACPALGTFKGSPEIPEIARTMAKAVRSFTGGNTSAAANPGKAASSSSAA